MNKPLLALVVFIWLCGSAAMAQNKKRPAWMAECVSDIHFNPFYDSTLVDTLVKTPVEGWQGIFESSSVQATNGYGKDANYPLIRSAIAALSAADPHPRCIVITGDFLCHDFQSTYTHYAGAYPDSLQTFTAKTIQFLAGLFDKGFPQTEVLPALGNNDSYCADYDISANSPFLTMFARAWVRLQRNESASRDRAFIEQFTRGGYYEHKFGPGKGSLLVLNTVFFSAKYANDCAGDNAGDPGAGELRWLEARLRSHQRANIPVWMAFHIAPGADVHSSLRSKADDCASKTVLMWKDSTNSLFLSMMKRYAATIRVSIAGHTHADDFRVIYGPGSVPRAAILITPAISPLFGNNPGFKLLRCDGETMKVLGSQTHYLNISQQATEWSEEYDFGEAYKLTGGINPASLDRVRKRIATDSVYRSQYIRSYSVGNPTSKEITSMNWMAFWCGMGNLTRSAFAACYCQIVH